jgi:hypothetical protein
MYRVVVIINNPPDTDWLVDLIGSYLHYLAVLSTGEGLYRRMPSSAAWSSGLLGAR